MFVFISLCHTLIHSLTHPMIQSFTCSLIGSTFCILTKYSTILLFTENVHFMQNICLSFLYRCFLFIILIIAAFFHTTIFFLYITVFFVRLLTLYLVACICLIFCLVFRNERDDRGMQQRYFGTGESFLFRHARNSCRNNSILFGMSSITLYCTVVRVINFICVAVLWTIYPY